ncbi:MAG: ABC transporter ATP-binding protein [Dehalococcoidia bacterium]|nr:ABC transporter ATP-binding protein [Dehalococcoidia bacterium]MDD5493609.1 ABC transporter ATP-binding protein [Dehalococcoidia bacterium]
MLLEIIDIAVHYGKAEVLRDLSLHVAEGEIVTIIGANGAGKSTTLRAISGLKSVSAGEIKFNGKRISGLKSHEIVRLGISHVPEGRRILAPLSVMENLEIGAYLRKSKKEADSGFQNIFDHFPILRERKNQIAGSLSGGEQQMLAIARALLNQPRLMMMDEPSMGLSPLVVEQVGMIIKEINGRGISIILVEQNARMALNLAQRAYVLEAGRCVLEGEAGAMVDDERIKHAYLGG